MRSAAGVILIAILGGAPIACGKDVSLGSGPRSPADASVDQPDDRAVGGVKGDVGGPDIPELIPGPRGEVGGTGDVLGVPGIDAQDDIRRVAGSDARPD